MSPVKLFHNQNVEEIFLITKPLVITNTPPSQLRSVHIVFLILPWWQPFFLGVYSCCSIHSPYFHFLLLFPMGKTCLLVALLFALIWLVLLRLLESDCPNYYNKALSQNQHNRHEQLLDHWTLLSGYLIPFILWSDTLVGLLYTPYASGPKSVPLNGLILNFSFNKDFIIDGSVIRTRMV